MAVRHKGNRLLKIFVLVFPTLLFLVSEIRGRMMEDIILLETQLAQPSKEVFKLQFTVGEFDMVVFDPETIIAKTKT